MVKINRFIPQRVSLFSPEDEFLGMVNIYEFNDVRVQIMQSQLAGYYVVFNTKKIYIDHNGKIENWPEGLFDHLDDMYFKLIGAYKK